MSYTPENIIDAAGELFMTMPYHKVTMDKVRNKVGVGKGTLYRHFGSKEDLYCKVVLFELDRLLESVLQAETSPEAGPAARLRELSERMSVFFETKKPLFALLRSEELRGSQAKKKLFRQWRERSNKLIDVFEEIITAGINCGIYSDRIPARTAAEFLLAMLKSGYKGRGHGSAVSAENNDVVKHALLMFETGMKNE